MENLKFSSENIRLSLCRCMQDTYSTTQDPINNQCIETYAYFNDPSYSDVHSLATLLGTPCYYWVGPPFAFRTAFVA